MDTIQLLGSSLGLGLLAGIRLYATVLAAGLAIRFGWIDLPVTLEHLRILSDARILSAAGVGVVMEFFADKVPWVDSLWDSVHTFIRPIGAALLGSTILASSDPATQALVALLCGGVALSGHSTKAATRLAVNQSPEPFSNVALSLAEDAVVPVGVWVAVEHPQVMLGILAVFLALFAWLAPKLFRVLRVQAEALKAMGRRWFGGGREAVATAGNVGPLQHRLQDEVPEAYREALASAGLPLGESALGVRCVASRRLKGLRNSIGYLCVSGDQAAFVTRRLFRFRTERFPASSIRNAEFQPGIFLDRLHLQMEGRGEVTFYLFKDTSAAGRDMARMMLHPTRP